MDLRRLPLEVVYQLSHEYRNHAYSVSGRVKNEEHLRQYYTLISMAIKALLYIKSVFPLSIDQDLKVTLEVVELLLDETQNVDMAESLVSSVRERLQNHQFSGSTKSLLNEKMQCELLLLYQIPLRRNSRFHYKAALRSCDELVNHLSELQEAHTLCQQWLPVFQYVSTLLNVRLGKHSMAKTKFNDLLQNPSGSREWQTYVTLCHFNYLLDHRFPIPQTVLWRVQTLDMAHLKPQWYAWKLLLEVTMLVYEDRNITEKLKELKEFFSNNKDSLNNSCEKLSAEIGSDLSLSLQLPSLLNYKDLKNILLLLQSVSYLANCHDKNANFSTRFLPKVASTTNKLLESVKERMISLNEMENNVFLYRTILSITNFYQVWESLLLTSDIQPSDSAIVSGPDYSAILNVMSSHSRHKIDDLNICEEYEKVAESRKISNEAKIISLLNVYLVRTSLISKDVQRQAQIAQCNILWNQINKALSDTDLQDNATWNCTITMVWIMSHFEPFTSNPMPATDEERNEYTERLRLYYSVNKIVPSEGKEQIPDTTRIANHDKMKVKKSLLIQILLNYLGGRLLEQNLEEICQISAACFRLAKIQNLPVLQYVVGLWHLMNCTLAMNSKEVTIMTSKLDALVKRINVA